MTLALKYRPRSLDDLIGQKSVTPFLRAMIDQKDYPSPLLFQGVKGTGKTSAARVLAAAVNCVGDLKPCAQCESCIDVFEGVSVDVLEIDAASNGLVDDIRSLQENLMHRPLGEKKIVILDEAHGLSRSASNALLKTLEEPPPNTMFILISTDSHKLLGTILSRCMLFTFRRVSASDLEQRLRKVADLENITVDNDLLKYIASNSSGSVRDALIDLDKLHRSGITTLAEYKGLVGELDCAPELLRLAAVGTHQEMFHCLSETLEHVSAEDICSKLVSCLRDVLVLHSHGRLEVDGEQLESRKALARLIPVMSAVASMKIVWDVKTKIRPSEETKGYIDLMLTMISEAIRGNISAPKPLMPVKSPEMTLEQLISAAS